MSWRVPSGAGRCRSGWSTSRSVCTPRPRTTTSTSTSSRRARRRASATSGSTRRPATRSTTRTSSREPSSSDGGYVMITQEELESVEPGQEPDHRHHRLRRRRGDRPDLLPEVLLPRPLRRQRQEGVHAAGPGHGQGRAHRGGDVRDAGQAVPRPRSVRPARCSCWRPCTSPTRSATPRRSWTSFRRGCRSVARTSTWPSTWSRR